VRRHIVLVTERLQVTTWRPEDVDEVHDLHSDPETMRWIRHGRTETRDEVETLLASYLREQQDRGWTKWRVANHQGVLVGRAGFGSYHHGNGRELGYTLRRDVWGRGLATEVATGLVNWHREQADAQLWAFAAVENTASCRVLEKVGFDHIGDAAHNGLPCARYRLAS
jgi:[ribosomal protein S5]-alanine N-acetyltransferase